MISFLQAAFSRLQEMPTVSITWQFTGRYIYQQVQSSSPENRLKTKTHIHEYRVFLIVPPPPPPGRNLGEPWEATNFKGLSNEIEMGCNKFGPTDQQKEENLKINCDSHEF